MTDCMSLGRNFLHSLVDADLDGQAQMIRAACNAGWGSWCDPVAGTLVRHPGTHQIEVTLFDIPATGDTPRELARNWVKSAEAHIVPPVAA